ncbi:hypothetical protein ALC57_06452 [Trachymyrmex cornetzi]|uniref:Reverse transcriptase domain-containing protein n=1 Tax=Trachymyrmex cornetzi TaxID=471704 RepID=A0A151J912_9HYME|nr:hypothetical protein ALC57_06452 [Trachymyrmex cornetzi]
MGQEGDVQRGGFRLDGPVTSRDKVDRRLCLLGSWWYTLSLLLDSKSSSLSMRMRALYRCGRIDIGMTAVAARRSGRGVKRICIDIWATVSRFPMKLLGPADPPNDDSSSQTVWFNALALRYSVAQITQTIAAIVCVRGLRLYDIFGNEEILRDDQTLFGTRSADRAEDKGLTRDVEPSTFIHKNENEIEFYVALSEAIRSFVGIEGRARVSRENKNDDIAFRLVLNSTFFTFNNKIYKQIFGTPMGSPLSPIVANMVMQDLEDKAI